MPCVPLCTRFNIIRTRGIHGTSSTSGSHCAIQCSCISRALARAQISSEKLSFPLNPASTVAEYTILFMINIGGRRTIAIGIRAVRYSHIAWAIVIVFTKGMRKVATNEQETERLRSTHSPTNENTPTLSAVKRLLGGYIATFIVSYHGVSYQQMSRETVARMVGFMKNSSRLRSINAIEDE